MIAALSPFGGTAGVIWPFAAGVLSVLLVAALVLTAIDFIKRLIE